MNGELTGSLHTMRHASGNPVIFGKRRIGLGIGENFRADGETGHITEVPWAASVTGAYARCLGLRGGDETDGEGRLQNRNEYSA